MKFKFFIFILLLGLFVIPVSAQIPTRKYLINNPISDGYTPSVLTLNISNSNGTNNNTHIFLTGNASEDFSDIIVVVNNDTANTLPYSINYTNLINGSVQMAINRTMNGSIQIYYGGSNGVCGLCNNSNATFSAWDNFTVTAGLKTNWTSGGTGSVSTAGKNLTMKADEWSNYPSPNPVSGAYGIVTLEDFKLPSTNPAGTQIAFYQIKASGSITSGFGGHYRKDTNTLSLFDNGIADTSVGLTLSYDTWYTVEQVFYSDYSWEIRIWQMSAAKPSSPTLSFGAQVPAASGTNFQNGVQGFIAPPTVVFFDNMSVRMFNTDVNWNTWGSQKNSYDVSYYSNNKTNNQSLNFFSVTGRSINFSTTTSSTTDTYSWFVNGTNQSWNFDNFNYSFPTQGTTYINYSAWNSSSHSYAYSNLSWNISIFNYSLQLLTPNASSIPYNNVTLLAREWPLNTPHTIYIATDNQFINTVYSGGDTTSDEVITFNVPVSLNPSTRYWWRVKNGLGIYTYANDFNTTSVVTTPGRFNISVWDEQYPYTNIVSTYTLNLYRTSDNAFLTRNTTTGWVNLTSSDVSSGEYLIIVVPNGSYSPRMILSTSPTNLTMYVPSTLNTIYLVSFSLLDVTGLFPYKTSTITMKNGNLTIDKSYFGADGTHAVYLLNGTNYGITVQNGNNIFNFGTYVPIASGTSSITIDNFQPNNTQIQPFSYNITYNTSLILLKWRDSGSTLQNLNYTVYRGTTYTEICGIQTSIPNGQSLCTIDNTTQYFVVFAAHMTDGTYQNTSFFIDYTVGKRKSSTGTSTITGDPIGIGFLWNRGNFTMPDWVYNWTSLIIIIVLGASFGGYYSGFGGILVGIFSLILEVNGLFRPLGSSDPDNLVIMSITGGFTLLMVLYFVQHKDRGG